MITSVCQFFDVFQVFTPPDTPCQPMYSSVQYLQHFIWLLHTSVNVKITSFPKPIESHLSVGVALTGFNNSSK